MEDQELGEAFDALRQMALERDLSWVVDQVDDEIRGGVTLELSEPVLVRLPGKKRASRISTGSMNRPFNSQEKLLLMIEALRRAVVLPALLEVDVIRQFRELPADVDDQPFQIGVPIGRAPEDADDVRDSTYTPFGYADRALAATRVGEALEALRREVDADAR